MSTAAAKPSSFLLVEEYFAQEDGRFLESLRWPFHPQRLAAFADRWKKDPRPWAREQARAYLALPLSVPFHQPVIKRLFKHAEQTGDHQRMADFLLAFDRLVRRKRRTRRRYEWNQATRQYTIFEDEELQLPRNTMTPLGAPSGRGAPNEVVAPYWNPAAHADERLFRYATRRYLRRRAWRYFRRMAHQQPEVYVREIAAALARYEDADLQRGEDLLESWGLINACFRGSPVLRFNAHGVRVRPGRRLAELSAAPYLAQVWGEASAAESLLGLVQQAHSRCVRVWAIQMLEREHASRLQRLEPAQLIALLDHQDDEVQQFAARLLGSLEGVSHWPIDLWLRLLDVQNPTALTLIADAMQKHVQGSRLDLTQCVALTTAASTPVARLGLGFLRERRLATAADRAQLAGLGQARCSALGAEICQWALSQVGTQGTYDRDVVLALLDALLVEIRTTAWDWLCSDPLVPADPVLWCRLLETPYEDLRLAIVDHLQLRATLPGTSSRDLTPIWSAVLVGVHRGGRQKLKAVTQIVEALADQPEQAGTLLPVLAVAIRSIRRPEARAGLAAVATLMERQPGLAESIARHVPELSFVPVNP